MVQEGRKGPSFTFHMHFQLHLLNVAPLSSTTFDLIVDLKPASRLALFDRQDYLRVFVMQHQNNMHNLLQKIHN
eukprot:UN08336